MSIVEKFGKALASENKIVRGVANTGLYLLILAVLFGVELGILWGASEIWGHTGETVAGWALSAASVVYLFWGRRPKKAREMTDEEAQATADKFRALGYVHAADFIEEVRGLKKQGVECPAEVDVEGKLV